MGTIVWDAPGKRRYEIGLDRGVLFPPDGTPVPWNGLSSVSENFNRSASAVYFDGRKIHEHVVLGEFSGSLKAVTYPSEFELLEGTENINCGVSIGEQAPQRFGLCYRTMLGNDQDGLEHYKLHVIYNLMASPATKDYQTMTETPAMVEFSWDLTSIPEEVPGHRPTSQLTIDSRRADSLLMAELEGIFYGTATEEPRLPSMAELIEIVEGWYRFRVVDNGDGTWTATEIHGSAITIGDDGYFEIDSDTAVDLGDGVYTLEDLLCVGPESLWVEIIDNGDGTWTALSPYGGIIYTDEDTGIFSIHNVSPVLIGPDTYRISNTFADRP